MGRPTQRTPENAKKIMDALRMGATYELACGYAGISKDTFDRWRDSDAAFAAQVKEAEGAAAVGWLAKIEKAANEGTWQAAAWKLERRYPESYGRQVTSVQHSGKVDVSKLSDDELRAIIEG